MHHHTIGTPKEIRTKRCARRLCVTSTHAAVIEKASARAAEAIAAVAQKTAERDAAFAARQRELRPVVEVTEESASLEAGQSSEPAGPALALKPRSPRLTQEERAARAAARAPKVESEVAPEKEPEKA